MFSFIILIIYLTLCVILMGVKYFHYVADIVTLVIFGLIYSNFEDYFGVSLHNPVLDFCICKHPLITFILAAIVMISLHIMAATNIKTNLGFTFISGCLIPITAVVIIDHKMLESNSGVVLYLVLALASTVAISWRTGWSGSIDMNNRLYDVLEWIGWFIAWIIHMFWMAAIYLTANNLMNAYAPERHIVIGSIVFSLIGAASVATIGTFIIHRILLRVSANQVSPSIYSQSGPM